MNTKKLVSLAVIGLTLLSLLSTLNFVTAYSTETTGLNFNANTMDTSQQCFVKIGDKNVFLVNSTLLIYSGVDASLTATLSLPNMSGNTSWYSDSMTFTNAKMHTAMVKFSDTEVIIGRIFTTGKASGSPDIMYVDFDYITVNVFSLAYNVLYTGYLTRSSISTVLVGDMIYNDIKLVKNINATGTFYYSIFGTALEYNNKAGTASFSIVGYLGTQSLNGLWSGTYSQKYYVSSLLDDAMIKGNTLIVDSTNGCPDGYFYTITTNNWLDGNRANVYLYNIATSQYTFVGVTPLDWTYTGYISNGGFGSVYLIGIGSYSDKLNVNIVYSTTNAGTQLNFGTITFNSSYVTATNINMGLNTGSLVIRPFTVIWSSGLGNSSSIYSVGYFDDVYGTWALTGISATLTDIETNEPTWEFYQSLFLYTPQLPQSYPYWETSNNWGGFQPLGSSVGLFCDVQFGKAKANFMYGNSNSYNFILTLSGDIFNGASIASAPTEITLKQGTTYSLTGKIYINSVLSGSGNFSIMTSDYNTNSAVFSSYELLYKTDGTITNGQFSFSLSPVTATTTVYRVLRINYTLTDNTQASYIYNFGYYALGGSGYNNGAGGVPYPTPATGGTGTGSGTGTTPIISIIPSGQETYFAIIIYVACLVGMIIGFYKLHNSNIPFAVGLGLTIGTILCNVLNILGIYTYPVDALTIFVMVVVILKGR